MKYATAKELAEFEARIVKAWEGGDLPFLLHLSGGNEDQLVRLFSEVREGDWVFSTHRSHYHALLAGVPSLKLEHAIRQGWSMFVFDRERNFYSSAILAGTCGIAAGVALGLRGTRSRVWCFLGDGAEEQGHFYEAVLFVEANGLPCTFIVEDNFRQVDTPKFERRGSSIIVNYPLDNFSCVRRVFYKPTWPHAGSGCKHKIEFKEGPIRTFLAK